MVGSSPGVLVNVLKLLLLLMKDSWVGVCVGVGRWFEKTLDGSSVPYDESTFAAEDEGEFSA